MCGIDGLLDPQGGTDAVIGHMNDCLRHRGPDDEGTWTDRNGLVALGHRRLSIIDLSPAGHQPMASASGQYVVVFNGEIYNFQQLRESLPVPDGGYRGHSDTEVMLSAFEHWGVQKTLPRLQGMFAIAVWDSHARQLVLARDRFGKKPLHYAMVGRRFIFASELKALHPLLPSRQVDPEAVEGFLQTGYVMGNRTVYQGVRKLPPASCLVVQPGQAPPEPKRYWSLDAPARAPRLQMGAAEAVDKLAALVEQATRDRMVADVPVGAFLSGGVDSSTVVAFMRQSSDRVRTYTIAWDDDEQDESHHARAVADHFGTQHHEHAVSETDVVRVVQGLADVYDEPFADDSQVPTLLVCEAARQHVTVALSGDGGDELFGGYNRYVYGAKIWSKLSRSPRPLRAGAALLADYVPVRVANSLGRRLQGVLPAPLRGRLLGDAARKSARLLRARSREEVYGILLTTGWPGGTVPRMAATPGQSFEEWMMLEDARGYLPDDILVKVDRASMSVGLEVRAPLLDHRLYEFAARLPLDLRVRGATTKWLLRQVLYQHVPSELIERPKMGFGTPLAHWLRGPLRDWAGSVIDRVALRRSGLDADLVHSLWQEHQSNERDWGRALWTVLLYQQWHDRWMT